MCMESQCSFTLCKRADAYVSLIHIEVKEKSSLAQGHFRGQDEAMPAAISLLASFS